MESISKKKEILQILDSRTLLMFYDVLCFGHESFL